MTPNSSTPFHIFCETCRARLVVEDPALVGLVVSCPKCDGMVEVKPPAGWNAAAAVAAAATVSSPMPPKAAKPAEVPKPEVAKPASAKPAPAPMSPQRAAAPPPLPKMAKATSAAPAPVVVAASAGEHTAPQAQLSSRQAWLMRIGIASVGAAATIGVLWIVFGRGSNQPVREEAAAHTESAPAASAAPNDQEKPKTEATPGQDAERASDPPADATLSARLASPAEQASREESSADPIADAPAPKAPEQPAAAKPEPPAPAVPAPPNVADQPVEAPIEADASEVPMKEEAAPQPKQDDVPAPARATPKPPPIERTQIEAHLGDRLPKVELKDAELSKFAEVMSEFSTIPIRLDRTSLAKIHMGPNSLISVKLVDTTVGAVLQAALEPRGMQYEVRDAEIVISAQPAKKK